MPLFVPVRIALLTSAGDVLRIMSLRCKADALNRIILAQGSILETPLMQRLI
jgi:hypothetical protein